MIDFSDNTTTSVYYAAISLLSISLVGSMILLVKTSLNLKNNNRHRYQVFLIGLNIAISTCSLIEIISLVTESTRISKWMYNIFDFTAFTMVLLSQLEILRLFEVITNLSQRYLRLIQILVMSYNVVTGGYHFFFGILFISLDEDNLFAKVYICN
ncbi:hypothetical protein BC833DRAFT_576200 [Globomyces pollinis-pini]|nr:hypothetical protein BC833DRAFT_576200 [Globomyces pollinis-pini]